MQEISVVISSCTLLLMIFVLRRLSEVIDVLEAMNETDEVDEKADARLENDLNSRLDQLQRARFSSFRPNIDRGIK